ncbi:iron-containing alcohol dehydrogenase [Nakamurella sp. GG22]
MSRASFEFATVPRIVVGTGTSAEVPAMTAGLGTRVLVCTGGRPERHHTLVDALSLPFTVVPVSGEPTVDTARSAVALARDFGADVVLAVGGGSVLDLGKATAALLANGGDPLDYLEVIGDGRPLTEPALPTIAVPTTSGTGSEVTANAVLASPQHSVKASLRDPSMLPAIAVVDADLTAGCPPAVTAASGLDALTQCLEPYVSPLATPLTDGLALQGLRRAASGLRRAYADGEDRAARADMAVCSLLSGMALANAKLGAVHGFAGVLGGMTVAPHGAICAALLAPVIEANVAALQRLDTDAAQDALEKYRGAAGALTGRDDAWVGDGVDWIRETVRELSVPGLAGLGIDVDAAAADVVAAAKASSSMKGNPVTLSDAELRGVLEAAR